MRPASSPRPAGCGPRPSSASFIRSNGRTADFGIGASCHPEVHPEADSPDADIAFLREKVDAGAEFLISQLFFDNDVYFAWLEDVRAAGIDVPIIPGILPIISRAGLHRFCSVCDAQDPR